MAEGPDARFAALAGAQPYFVVPASRNLPFGHSHTAPKATPQPKRNSSQKRQFPPRDGPLGLEPKRLRGCCT
jgi:hypothetical protein